MMTPIFCYGGNDGEKRGGVLSSTLTEQLYIYTLVFISVFLAMLFRNELQ